MLLRFSAIPRTSQVEVILLSKTVKPRPRPGVATPKAVIQISESEHSSDSEQEEVNILVPRYVPPNRSTPSGSPTSPGNLHFANFTAISASRSHDHIEDSIISNSTNSSSGPLFRSVSSSHVQSSRSASTSNIIRDLSGYIPLWPVVPDETDSYPNASEIGYINRVLIIKTRLSILFDFIIV